MLTPAQLITARRLVVSRLPARCTVKVMTDTAGEQDWDTTGDSDVPCQVGYPRQGGAMGMVDRLGNEPGVVIWVPVDTTVKSGDEITVGGVSYRVAFVPPLRSQDLLRGLTCIELRDAGAVA